MMLDYRSVLKFLADVALLLLFIRYITYGYGSYAGGGLFPFLRRATEMFCAPLRPFIPLRVRVRSDYTPVLAMGLIVIGRGLLYSVGDLMWQGTPPARTLPFNVRLSVVEFLDGALWVAALFLFFGAALLRGGGHFSNVLFRVVSDRTAAIFRSVYRVVRTGNEWALFVASLAVLSLAYALLWAVLTWNPFVPFIWLRAFLMAGHWTLAFFSIVLFVSILLSWFSPDPHNPFVQALAALTYPALDWARRTFPWARIDIIDLSPLLIFLVLMVAQSVLLSIARQIPRVAAVASF